MKKTFLLFTLLFLTSLSSSAWVYRGKGTAENPYKVQTVEDLIHVSDYTNQTDVHFRMTNDIAIYGREWTPISTFKGVFDGDGHTIAGLYISTNNDGAGLFARVNYPGEIRNLTVDQAVIAAGSWSGILVSTNGNWQEHGGTIRNCHVKNTFISAKGCTGGIAGVSSGEIIDCSATNCVIKGYDHVGGIVGHQEVGPSYVADCFFIGNVSGTGDCVGGIIGYSNTKKPDGVKADVYNCASYGSVKSSTSKVGGIVGEMTQSATNIVDCYSECYIGGTNVGGILGGTQNATVTNCVFMGGYESSASISGPVVNGVLTNQTAQPVVTEANNKNIKVTCSEPTENLYIHTSYEGEQRIQFFHYGNDWTARWVANPVGSKVYAVVKAKGKMPSERVSVAMATVSRPETWTYSTANVNGENYADDKVVTHAVPSGYAYNGDATRKFNVAVNGHYAPTYSDVNFWNSAVNFSMFEFENGEEVCIDVVRDQGFTTFRILPHDLDIYDVVREGNCISFKTRKADQKMTIVYDEDYHGGFIHMFPSSIDHSDPKLATSGYVYDEASKTHYFAPGYHNLYSSYDNGMLEIKDDTKVYVASGAVLNGILRVSGGNGAKISGRGLVATNQQNILLSVDWSGGPVDVEGLTFHGHRAQCWTTCVSNCYNVHFKNINIVSTRCVSSDGLDVANTSNSTFENMFIHSADDAIAVKGNQKGVTSEKMPNKNLRFRYIQTWNDCNCGLGIGAETKCYYSDIRFDDCYKLFQHDDGYGANHTKFDYCAAMNICSLSSTYFSDIHYEDIYVYHAERLIGMCFIDDFVFGSIKGDMSGEGSITNVTFKNVFSPYKSGTTIDNNMRFAAWTTAPVKPIHFILFYNLAVEGNQILDYRNQYNTWTDQVWDLFYAGESAPWINTSTESVDLATECSTPVSAQLTVNGGDLYSNMRLSIAGDDARFFTIDRNTIDRKAGETAVTVVYNPTEAGQHSARLKVESDDIATRTIALNGTATKAAESGVDDVAKTNSKVGIVYYNNVIRVTGAECAQIEVFNALGALAASALGSELSTNLFLPGIYVVKAVTETADVATLKIIIR